MMTLEELRKKRQEIRRELDYLASRKKELKKERARITRVLKTVRICKNCDYCMIGDGEPYCAIQDLYTHVNIEAECTEKTYLERKNKKLRSKR